MKKLLSTLALAATLVTPLVTQAQTTVTVKSGDLIKGSYDTVYYLYDGKRLVFPSEKTYKSWYADFSTVKKISDDQLMTYPLKANVTYKPGTRLLKITTDPKVYAVSAGGVLRWVATEAVAQQLWGNDWATKVDDLADSFFINYKIGDPIQSPSDFNPQGQTNSATSIWFDKGYAQPSDSMTGGSGY